MGDTEARPYRKGKGWSADETVYLRSHIQAGETTEAIAQALGRTQAAVKAHAYGKSVV